ncbi:MAG: hypothetical protein CMB80_33995 [Flammeovirgaceae bacterium]|nr:hypothetical protein [Flammeovirgaceae bacterium]
MGMKYPLKDYLTFAGSVVLMVGVIVSLIVLITMARHKVIDIQCEEGATKKLAGLALCPPPIEVPR